MDTHVKVVAALNIFFGGLGVLGALVLMLIFGGVSSLVGMSGDPDAAVAVPIIGLTGMALVIVTLVLSVPSVFVGVGMWRRAPWARIGGIVLAILNLIWVPFGTLIGIYSLWVLFSKETEALFTPGTMIPAPPSM